MFPWTGTFAAFTAAFVNVIARASVQAIVLFVAVVMAGPKIVTPDSWAIFTWS
jgi:hypothetical protein